MIIISVVSLLLLIILCGLLYYYLVKPLPLSIPDDTTTSTTLTSSPPPQISTDTVPPSLSPPIIPSIAPSIAPPIVPSIAPPIVPSIAPPIVPSIAPSIAPPIVRRQPPRPNPQSKIQPPIQQSQQPKPPMQSQQPQPPGSQQPQPPPPGSQQPKPPIGGNDCLSLINAFRQKQGVPALTAATDAQTTCSNSSAVNDAAKGYHNSFGKCGEKGQCECSRGVRSKAGETGLSGCVGAYIDEGPGGGHYEILKGANYKSVACGTDGNGFFTHNFF